MEFLCPNHRQQFAELPLEERKDLWLFWMENAQACSEQGQWRDVISLSGSAFDLACLQGPREESCMHIELTLSAILVSRALSDRGDRAGMDAVILRALDCLQQPDYQASAEGCCDVHECVAVLIDPSRHAEFFADYLNWPYLPFVPRKRVTMVRTLH